MKTRRRLLNSSSSSVFFKAVSADPQLTTVAVECRKGMDHIGSHAKASFQGEKKLDTMKGGQNTHAEHAASMSARVVEREKSIALSAWHLRDNAPRSTLLIDEHDLRLGTSLVGFM